MLCIYVALNQRSTHCVDLLMGTKRSTSKTRRGFSMSVRGVSFVFTDLLIAASPLGSSSHLKPAAGHCRTSGMRACGGGGGGGEGVPGQQKKGGEPALLILHPSPGNNGPKPS